MLRYAFGSLVLISAAMAASGVSAANKLKIGDAGPAWTALDGTDSKPHSLADYKDAKALVVVFTCNHCPVATAYQERLIALQKDYQEKGVQVVAICVSKGEADDLAAMKKRAESAGFNFPYLYDPTQKSGMDYGATCTPHVFVLDKERKLAYMGAIDDNWQKVDDVKKHYLSDALDAILDGKQPESATTRQVGCGIRYE
jgi:peroxiredoxin